MSGCCATALLLFCQSPDVLLGKLLNELFLLPSFPCCSGMPSVLKLCWLAGPCGSPGILIGHKTADNAVHAGLLAHFLPQVMCAVLPSWAEGKNSTLKPKVALRAAADPNTMSMAVQRGLRWGMTSGCALSLRCSCATMSSPSGTAAASMAHNNLHDDASDRAHQLLLQPPLITLHVRMLTGYSKGWWCTTQNLWIQTCTEYLSG